jgi:hypothetical protein
MSGKWIAMFLGLYVIILILASVSSGGTVVSADGTQSMTQMEYLINIKNAVQQLPVFGGIPLPLPNPEYFGVLWDTITLQPVRDMFDTGGFVIFYWIVIIPIVCMAVYALVSLFMGVIRGNLTW